MCRCLDSNLGQACGYTKYGDVCDGNSQGRRYLEAIQREIQDASRGT